VESAEFVVLGARGAVSGEGVGAVVAQGRAPMAQAVLRDAESARHLGDGEVLLGQHLQGL
jgi:hypothetical protein